LSWGLGDQDKGFGDLVMEKFNTSVQFLPLPFLPKIGTAGSCLMKVHLMWGKTPTMF